MATGSKAARARRNLILRWFLHLPVSFYRWGFGWLLGKRFLLLTHVGRRTGLVHQTVLEVMEYRAGSNDNPLEVVVMSGFGRNADWLRNIEVNARVEIAIASRRFLATYRFLIDREAVGVVRNYERRHRLMAPLIRLVLSKLLGWKYSASDSDVERLVAQLPLIAFSPRSGQ